MNVVLGGWAHTQQGAEKGSHLVSTPQGRKIVPGDLQSLHVANKYNPRLRRM